MSYTAEFGEGLVNEDEGDKDGEDLLGEAGDEAHQEAALYRYHQHDDDNEPHPDPHSTYDVLDVPRLTELAENVTHTKCFIQKTVHDGVPFLAALFKLCLNGSL